MSVFFEEKMLSQMSGFSTTAMNFYQKVANKRSVVKRIEICNTNSAASTFSIYFNNSAAVFGTTHASYFNIAIGANTTWETGAGFYWALGQTGGAIGWLPGTTGMVVKAFGAEIQES